MIITGCKSESKITQSVYMTKNIEDRTKSFKQVDFQNITDYEVQYFELPLLEEEDISDFTVFGDKIYYIAVIVPDQANFAEKSRVYEYDTYTEKSKLIYETGVPEVRWMNELRADDKKIYWTSMAGNKNILESFELETQKKEEIKVLYSEEVYQPIVLGGGDDYLSWYEYDDKAEVFKLMLYDLKEGIITDYADKNLLFDTYTRSSTDGDKALILKLVNNEVSFDLINISNKQSEYIFSLSDKVKAITPQVSGKYIVWWNDYGGSIISVYDMENEDIWSIDFDELNIDIFSMHIDGDVLYINTGEDIYYCNLEEKNYGILTENIPHKESTLDIHYTLSKITIDKQYVSKLERYPQYCYVCIIKYN